MVWVDDYVSNDMTGSLPGNRTDIAALLERATTRKDYRYVLSQRIDRGTRSGSDHLGWVAHELRMRGVKILYPGDNLPDGTPYGGILRSMKADAAQDTSKSTGQRSAQGSQFALERRQVSPHSRTPFGCHRLYCRSDDTPLFALRDLRDGRQEKLSWPDLQVVDTYGQVGGKAKGHYRKQKSELVYLVPGDPMEQAVVRDLFRLRYVEGRGGRSIASILNGRGVRAPQGGPWSPRQVESIYENEDYTGVAIANRVESGIYYARQSGRPKEVELDDQEATTAERVKPELRPKEEWYVTTEPYLVDFLGDEPLRQVGIAQQAKRWERRLDPTWERPNKTKYPTSPYLLTDLLVAKQDRELLVGNLGGPPGKKVRQYRHKRAARECLKGSAYNKVFNADVLERAILAVLQEVLLDWPELEPRLLAHVHSQMAAARQGDDVLVAKCQERDEVREQLLLYIRMLSPKTRQDLAVDIGRLEARRDALDAEIDALKLRGEVRAVDPAAIATAVRTRLTGLAAAVPNLPPHVLKQVLSALTASLEADMETKAVSFAFRLPSWAVWHHGDGADLTQLCLRHSSESSTGPQTHLPLAAADCEYRWHRGSTTEPPCYACVRSLRHAGAA